jgi:hypothetical protein
MPTDDPTTPPRRGEGGVPTRELLFRTVVRIRRDIRRLQQLADVLGVNQPRPPEVDQAIKVLDRWSKTLVRASRPGPGRHR